jgi:photosystem II stability/assembly factor-like uncharacterized protein
MTDDDLHDQFGDEIAEALRLDQVDRAGSTVEGIKRDARRLRGRRRIIAVAAAVMVAATVLGVVASRAQSPNRVSVVTSPSSSAVPPTTKAIPTTTSPSVAGDSGILQEFTPVSTSTWWAVVGDNLKPTAWVVRTTDRGRHWRNVSPISNYVGASYFLSDDVAWIEAGSLASGIPKTEPVYRTLDGGRSWQRLGSVPNGCELQFVDQLRGWCTAIGAAAGSEEVEIRRTTDGGTTWTLASRTGIPGNGPAGTPDAVPFGCDKSVTFTSAQVGWAPFFCAGGVAQVYKSTDAGSTWHFVPGVPLPPHGAIDDGSGFGVPVVRGSEIALTATVPGRPGVIGVDVSADGGATWRSASLPDPTKQWVIDLVDPTHWRMTDGKELTATDDAGAHWRPMTPPPLAHDPAGTLLRVDSLDFLTPQLGWASQGPGGAPLWWTRDSGNSWQPVSIPAGPYQLGAPVR